jgi:hypothetical protein
MESKLKVVTYMYTFTNFSTTVQCGDVLRPSVRLSVRLSCRLAGRRPVARTVGTSVRVEGLFEALPVRRGDFVR